MLRTALDILAFLPLILTGAALIGSAIMLGHTLFWMITLIVRAKLDGKKVVLGPMP